MSLTTVLSLLSGGAQIAKGFYAQHDSKTKVGVFLDNLFTGAEKSKVQVAQSTQQQNQAAYVAGQLGSTNNQPPTTQNSMKFKEWWNTNKKTVFYVVGAVTVIGGIIAMVRAMRKKGRRYYGK